MSKKLTQLPELTTPDDADQLVLVDTEVGSTKRITRGNLLADAIGSAELENNAVITTKIADNGVTGSKIATYKIARDNNGTSTTETAARILTGWGWMQIGAGGSGTASETVTFNTPFTNRPIVLITFGGDAGNVAAALGTGSNTVQGKAAAKVYDVTTTSFAAYVWSAGTNWAAADTVYYHWMAIGT